MTMLVALVALSAQDRSVTFSHRCTGAKTVVEALGKALGTEMTVDATVAERDLYVRVTDVPREDLLKAVAASARGVWRTTKEGMVLAADPAFARSLKEWRTKALAAGWASAAGPSLGEEAWSVSDARKAVDAAFESVRTQRPGSTGYPTDHETRDPRSRLVHRLVRSIGFEVLASLPIGRRVVWSTAPTRMQMPLPPSAAQAIQDYEVESERHNQALDESGVAARLPEAGWTPPVLRQSFGASPTKTTLAIQSTGSGLSVNITMLLSNGALAWWANYGLEEPQRAATPAAAWRSARNPVVWSEEAAVALDLAGVPAKRSDPDVRKQVLSAYLDSSKSTLIQAPLSDMLDATVGDSGLDVVCSQRSSGSLLPVVLARDRAATTDKHWGTPRVAVNFDEIPIPGIVVLVPSMVIESSQAMRRRVTEIPIALSLQDGEATLEELADIAKVASHPDEMSFGFMSLLATRQQTAFGELRSKHATLRVYGLLSETDRRKARSGGATFRVSGMPPAIAEAYRRIVFDQEPTMNSDPSLQIMVSVNGDPTEALPQGLPADGPVTIKVTGGPSLVFFRGTANGSAHGYVTDPESAAQMIAEAEKSPSSVMQTSFAVTGLESLRIDGLFGPSLFHASQVTLVPSPEAAKAGAWTALPVEFRKAIEAALPEARRAWAGSGAGRTIPPSP